MTEWILSSSFLILTTLLLRKLLRSKISRALQYSLWLLVLVRLLCPVQLFESPVPIASTLPSFEMIDSEPIEFSVAELGTAPIAAADAEIGSAETVSATTARAEQTSLSLTAMLKLIWMCGSILCGLWFLFVNLHFSRTLRKNRTPWSLQNKLLPIYVVDGIASPCLFGLFRPAIYLTPQAVASGVQTSHVILHELCHYRHRDHIWSLLRCLCLVIFWWNPLVWIAARCSRQDGELCCDESVIRLCGERLAYGKTLVDIIAKKPTRPTQICAATTMFSDETGLKERVKNIASRPKTAVPAMVVALLVAVLLTACSFAEPVENNQVVEDDLELLSELRHADRDNADHSREVARLTTVTNLNDETWLDYADNSRILFHNTYGIFLYDRDTGEIIANYDFFDLFGTNALWSPGVSEPSIQVTVASDGSSAMMFCRGTDAALETAYYLNLSSGILTQDCYGLIQGSTSDFGERGDDALELLERTSGNVVEGEPLYVVNCLILNNNHIGLIRTDNNTLESLCYTEYNQLGECTATIPLFENYAQ